MAFETYSKEQLLEHLWALGVRPGMKIVVHSALTSFGKILGRQETVLSALMESVGSDGLVMVPTFTFNLDPDKPFNKFKQPPTGMGALANYVWNIEEGYRTNSCIHSYTAIGKGAEELEKVKTDRSFGEGSFFHLAEEENFLWVMLGCKISDGCTLLHHVEAVHGVPYREWAYFPRKLECSDGGVRSIRYRYFKVKDDFMGASDFSSVQERMLTDGSMTLVQAPYGQSLSAFSSKIVSCGLKLLQEDNTALTSSDVGAEPH